MTQASKDFGSFGEILGRIKLPKAVKEHLKNHEVWARWGDIVGVELSRLTAPLELRNRVLEIHVAHQAWAQQLQFLKPSILGKIRNLCPSIQVKDLQFRVGKVEARSLPNKNESVEFEDRLKLRQVRLTERQEITLRGIDDPELRSSIRRAMEAASKRGA